MSGTQSGVSESVKRVKHVKTGKFCKLYRKKGHLIHECWHKISSNHNKYHAKNANKVWQIWSHRTNFCRQNKRAPESNRFDQTFKKHRVSNDNDLKYEEIRMITQKAKKLKTVNETCCLDSGKNKVNHGNFVAKSIVRLKCIIRKVNGYQRPILHNRL